MKTLLLTAVKLVDSSLEMISCSQVTKKKSLEDYSINIYHILFYSFELLSGIFTELSIIQNVDEIGCDLGDEPTDEADILTATEKYLKTCKALLAKENPSFPFTEMEIRAQTLFCVIKEYIDKVEQQDKP
jgi:hypothetical protein